MFTVEGSQYYRYQGDYTLRSGETLSDLVLAYEMHGKLNEAKDNVILIHHALSPSHHVAAYPANHAAGWWNDMVGRNKAINTDRWCVLCINNLGSCFGSTGPASISLETGQPYGASFPVITMQDMVDVQIALLKSLGIMRLACVVGSSMGGMLSLQMALDHPAFVQKLISIASTYKAYSVNRMHRAIQKRLLQLDVENIAAHADGENGFGFNLARQIGYLLYRNPSQLNVKFQEDVYSEVGLSEIENYFHYNARKFTDQFDPYCYLTLLESMDRFDITQGEAALKDIQADCWVIAINSDRLFCLEQQEALYALLQSAQVNTKMIQHQSDYGHDAFLIEQEKFGMYLNAIL